MKVLTLTQPWATLVAIGAKRIETRSWATSYRGPLAIHAAKGLGPVGGMRGLIDLCECEPFCSVLTRHGVMEHGLVRKDRTPLGAIVAVCMLWDCVPTNGAMTRSWFREYRGGRRWEITDQERAFGDYSPGRFAWLLADVRPLPNPIPCKGALGLWEPDAATLAAIQAQLAAGGA